MLTGRTSGARLLVDGYVHRLCGGAPQIDAAPDVSDVHECVDCGQPDELCECNEEGAPREVGADDSASTAQARS